MEGMQLVRSYLHNLVRADAVIHCEVEERVVFNDASTPGSFNSRIFSEEIMIVKKLSDIGVMAQTDQNIRMLLTRYLTYLSRLFHQEAEGGWSHRCQHVMRDGKRVAAGELCQTTRRQLGEYVEFQHEAFQRIGDIFLPFLPAKTEDYRMNLNPTEFIELTMLFQTSGRMECIGGRSTMIGMARYLAKVLGVVFPNNYDSLKSQLLERGRGTIFWNFLHSSFITYLHNRK